MPDFDRLTKDLKRPHVTKKLLRKEYVDSCRGSGYKPYGISQFNAMLNEYMESHKLSMRRDRNPGEVLELDWSGSVILLYTRTPGIVQKCHLFVAAFSYSGYFFAEAFADEKIHSWVQGIVDSFNFFGGVPVIHHPDNTKTATIKADKYEPQLNPVMLELSEYYGTVTIPARVREPRDKNVVENSFPIASLHIIGALRNQKFYSMHEMNTAILERVIELNEPPFTNKEGSRALLFEEEKIHLLPLTCSSYQLFERTRAKVAPDYHIHSTTSMRSYLKLGTSVMSAKL